MIFNRTVCIHIQFSVSPIVLNGWWVFVSTYLCSKMNHKNVTGSRDLTLGYPEITGFKKSWNLKALDGVLRILVRTKATTVAAEWCLIAALWLVVLHDNNQSESCFQTSLCSYSYSCSFCSYQYSRYVGVQGTSYDGKSTAQQHLLGHTDVDHTHSM